MYFNSYEVKRAVNEMVVNAAKTKELKAVKARTAQNIKRTIDGN